MPKPQLPLSDETPSEDPLDGLLGKLEGTDWDAAESRAQRAGRRRRGGGHALLLVGVLAIAVIVWLARSVPTLSVLSQGAQRDPSLVLVEALADDNFWRVESVAWRDRVLPALAVYALAHAHREESSAILEQPLIAATARLVDFTFEFEPSSWQHDQLAALLRALALHEAGVSLNEPRWELLGREQLAALLADLAPSVRGGRLDPWLALAHHALAQREAPLRARLAEALGGPPGDDPVWRAAAEVLLKRR